MFLKKRWSLLLLKHRRQTAKFRFVGEFYLKEYATVRRGFFFGLQQVIIWFSVVRICPLKRWSYFVLTD